LFSFVQAQDQPAPAPADQSLPESDTAIATRHALQFADSLVRAEFYTDWNTYLALACPTAIKYFGGKDAFKEQLVNAHYRSEPRADEKPAKLNVLSMMNDIETWQCVIEKLRETFDESRGKVKIFTYLVGESTDNGLNWKFADVSLTTLENFNSLMPTIFGNLAIPEGKTIYVDEVAAQEAAQQAAQPVAKKKPVKKSTR
jgi:hypothetical protein